MTDYGSSMRANFRLDTLASRCNEGDPLFGSHLFQGRGVLLPSDVNFDYSPDVVVRLGEILVHLRAEMCDIRKETSDASGDRIMLASSPVSSFSSWFSGEPQSCCSRY